MLFTSERSHAIVNHIMRKDIPITIVRSPRRSIALQIQPDGSVLVRAPRFILNFQINRFIEEHADWIEKHVGVLEKSGKKKRQFIEGEEFLYMGKTHILTLGPSRTIETKDERLYFPKFLAFRMQKELTEWYQKQAQDIISERVAFHAKSMGVSYSTIYFSDTKSKWGSCSHDDKLQFNWRLIMAPYIVINYVVVHELSHIREKNHSRAFWKIVEMHNPSYRQQIKWLKTNGHSLHL